MNPLEPNDPLWNLLGKARKVEVRGNFVQNVVRAARQEPQVRSRWQRVREWMEQARTAVWFRPALVAAAVVVTGAVLWNPEAPQPEALVQAPVSTPVIAESAAADAEDLELLKLAESLPTLPLDSVNQMDVLLAMDDTSALTDTEIAFLLY